MRLSRLSALVTVLLAISSACSGGNAPTPATPTHGPVVSSTATALRASPALALPAGTPTLAPPANQTPPPATPPPSPTEAGGSACASVDGLPDRGCTPGVVDPRVTQDNIDQTICVSGYTKTVRPPTSYTTPLKIDQMALYGWTGSTADYEEDHLIPLEVGGHPTDPKNLWPEPYNVPNGARQKDKVENLLHSQVCSGQMTLADAQNLIATNWEAVEGGGPADIMPSSSDEEDTPTPAAQQAPPGTLQFVSVTSPVSRGGSATVVVQTSPAASCTIVVTYKSGPSSAQGLGPKQAGADGQVSWTWMVGSRTTPGDWPITVTCGGQTIETTFTVTG